MGTCFVTKSKTTIKVSLRSLSILGKYSSNADIALKKEGVDCIATTVIVVVIEMFLLVT